MSEAARTGRRGLAERTWARALSTLGLVWTLGLLQAPQALAQAGGVSEGTRLVEIPDPTNRQQRLACQGDFCLWWTSTYSPCSGEYCHFDTLYVTDREDRVVSEQGDAVLGPFTLGRYTEEVRFIGPRKIEFLNHRGPFSPGRELGSDSGVDPSWVMREVWNLSADGKKLTQDRNAVRVPDWKRPSKTQKPAASKRPPPKPEKPSLESPVPEAVLAQARAACENQALHPLHYECHRGTCVLVLSTEEVREESSEMGHLCPLLVKGSEVRGFPSSVVTSDAVELELTPDYYIFTDWDGPYGSHGSEYAISRTRPESKILAATEGLHVEGSDPYPVRKAKTLEAARALAPTVHAYTRAHISWGKKGWRDEGDLALAWQAMLVGGDLRLHAEVDDDVVQPFSTGTGLHSDHLEFSVWRGPTGSFMLGVLLAPKGQLRVRLWEKEEDGKKQHLDEAFAGASGTWRQGEHGYALDLTLPLAAVQSPSAPLRSSVSVFISDTDTAGKQETLMGHSGTWFFWTEYPPSIDEYQRAHPHE